MLRKRTENCQTFPTHNFEKYCEEKSETATIYQIGRYQSERTKQNINTSISNQRKNFCNISSNEDFKNHNNAKILL